MTSGSSSVSENGKLESGIYKIQNTQNETYLDVEVHTRDICCRPTKSFGEGRGRSYGCEQSQRHEPWSGINSIDAPLIAEHSHAHIPPACGYIPIPPPSRTRDEPRHKFNTESGVYFHTGFTYPLGLRANRELMTRGWTHLFQAHLHLLQTWVAAGETKILMTQQSPVRPAPLSFS